MNEGWLEGKTALITGAASGIGRAASRLFLDEGAWVVGIDRDAAGLEETFAHVPTERRLILPAELTQSEQVAEVVQQAAQHFGRVDILFNVAGVSGRRWGDGPTAECSEEAWDLVMSANLKSQFLTCKYCIPIMLEHEGGSIINLSSVLGLVGGDSDFATHAYAASKGGIISLTRAIAAYYARGHIRANVICPGLIATPMSQRAQASEDIRARLPELQPLNAGFGAPDDVAQAALYLASDRAGFVTGAVLTVDGGWTVH